MILVVYSKLYICVMGRGDEIPSLHNMRKSISNNNTSMPGGLFNPSGYFCSSCQGKISSDHMQQLLSDEMAVLCADERAQSADEKIQSTYEKAQSTDEKIQITDEKAQSADETAQSPVGNGASTNDFSDC